MSISGALNNASLGLSVAARLADTISNNVSNAMTPGFGRRVTEVSSLALGGYGSGVRVVGTTRTENPFLTAERRAMDAALGAASATSNTYERVIGALGEPGSPAALATRATALETKLMAAVASPQSLTQLTEAAAAARALAQSVNGAAQENARLRTEADAEIARQVETMNDGLHEVRELNLKITTLSLKGEDVSALKDERERVIDRLSGIVPLRVANRENETVALYAANGGTLLDGRVWELKFTRGPTTVTPDMILGAPLSGLAQDRGDGGGPADVPVGTGSGLMDGGSLGALFETRDRIVPEFDAEMDLYAQELIARFRDLMPAAALDGAGDGLFVDAAPGALTGLAGRLAVNAAADPAQGGAAWRLRDGLSAAAPGDEGAGAILQGLVGAMAANRTPVGFVSQNAANGAAMMASEITSFFAGKSARSDDAQAYLTARQTALADSEANAIGVDSDRELQALMLIEQAYAANARVLSVMDGLLKLLLER